LGRERRKVEEEEKEDVFPPEWNGVGQF